MKSVCKVCESVWRSVWECMKLRIRNVLTETAPMIPQTPQTDFKYPYVPKMAIWTHCAGLLWKSLKPLHTKALENLDILKSNLEILENSLKLLETFQKCNFSAQEQVIHIKLSGTLHQISYLPKTKSLTLKLDWLLTIYWAICKNQTTFCLPPVTIPI